MLSKLLDMSNSRHLKRWYMQIMIKILKVKYGLEAASALRNNKHTGIKTNTTRRWINCSLRKQLIHLLLNNGMMSCSHLYIELPEVTEQGRAWPKLKMVTLNHIKDKPVRSNALPLIQKWEVYQPGNTKMRMMKRLWSVTHQECQLPWLPSS